MNDSAIDFADLKKSRVAKIIAEEANKKFGSKLVPLDEAKTILERALKLNSVSNILYPTADGLHIAPHTDHVRAKIFSELVENEFPACRKIMELCTLRSLKPAYRGNVRRVALAICLSSSISHLDEITETVWVNWLSSLRQNGKYRKDVYLSAGHIKGIIALADLLEQENDGAYRSVSRIARSPVRQSKRFRYGTDELISTPPEHLKEWTRLFVDFLSHKNLKSTKMWRSSFRLFCLWLEEYPQEVSISPLKFLSKERSSPRLQDFFLRSRNGNNLTPQDLTFIIQANSFTEWVVNTHMTDYDIETGDAVSIGVPAVSPARMNELKESSPSERKYAESASSPMPTKYLKILRDILEGDNYAFPKSMDNQHFRYLNPVSHLLETVWIPTLTILFLTMLELPLRRIQVLCLDSGEGDEDYYDPATSQWSKNKGKHGGYWTKHPSALIQNRGAIRKVISGGSESVGFYINTNKTADRTNRFDETSGYTIPWKNDYLIRKLMYLREWQETYNPVDGPTSYDDIPKAVFSDQPSPDVLKSIPERFYLFRTPRGDRGAVSYAPPSWNQCIHFWQALMDELEKRLSSQGDSLEIVTKRSGAGKAQTSIFNIHGLRVSGLTAFAEAGVPIEILSKLVAGHSTILMTIYYLKFSAAYVSDILSSAQEKIESSATQNLQNYLKQATWDEAAKISAYADENVIHSITGGSAPTDLFSDVGIGFCPWGGSRCGDGGEIIRKSAVNGIKDLHAPVPGGDGNCLRCRHFITGAPFLIPLWLKAEMLLADSQSLSSQVDENAITLEQLENEKFTLCEAGRSHSIPALLRKRIAQLEAMQEQKMKSLDNSLMCLHSAWRYINRIKEIIESDADHHTGTVDTPTLIADQSLEVEFREGTHFEQIDRIVQGSRVYPFLKDPGYEQERDRFIDTILARNGFTPLSMTPLSNTEKSRAADAAAAFLLTRIGAIETQLLFEGKQSLRDIGVETPLLALINDVSGNRLETIALSKSAINRPSIHKK